MRLFGGSRPWKKIFEKITEDDGRRFRVLGVFYFKLQICPHLITWRVEHNQNIMTIINVFIFQHNQNFPMFLRFFKNFKIKRILQSFIFKVIFEDFEFETFVMRMTWNIYFQLLQHYNWTLPVVEGRLLTLGHFQGYKEKGHKGVKKKGGGNACYIYKVI